MNFSEEQKRKIETLAGIAYTVEKIAMYMNIDPFELELEYENPDSEFRYHYDRGILMKEAERELSLSENARNGSITAIQMLERRIDQRKIEDFKQKLLHGLI
ncbi:MAG: hypothetical protein NTU44_04640 [Bacteroidetes bacterium]|nr:hypothetical protein [Bacteroidota bacterium]